MKVVLFFLLGSCLIASCHGWLGWLTENEGVVFNATESQTQINNHHSSHNHHRHGSSNNHGSSHHHNHGSMSSPDGQEDDDAEVLPNTDSKSSSSPGHRHHQHGMKHHHHKTSSDSESEAYDGDASASNSSEDYEQIKDDRRSPISGENHKKKKTEDDYDDIQSDGQSEEDESQHGHYPHHHGQHGHRGYHDRRGHHGHGGQHGHGGKHGDRRWRSSRHDPRKHHFSSEMFEKVGDLKFGNKRTNGYSEAGYDRQSVESYHDRHHGSSHHDHGSLHHTPDHGSFPHKHHHGPPPPPPETSHHGHHSFHHGPPPPPPETSHHGHHSFHHGPPPPPPPPPHHNHKSSQYTQNPFHHKHHHGMFNFGHHHEHDGHHGRDNEGACPMLYTRIGHRCVAAMSIAQVSWSDASNFCDSIFGDLISFGDVQEFFDFLKFVEASETKSNFWTGGKTDGDEWRWNDGSPMIMGSPFWAVKVDSSSGYSYRDPKRLSYVQSPNKVSQYGPGPYDSRCASVSYDYYYYMTDEKCTDMKSPVCVLREDAEVVVLKEWAEGGNLPIDVVTTAPMPVATTPSVEHTPEVLSEDGGGGGGSGDFPFSGDSSEEGSGDAVWFDELMFDSEDD